MPVWLERYILPVCVALVVGLAIFNPLKMDWQQRVSLLVAISAFAFFIGHSLHRTTKPAPADDLKISALEQQVTTVSKQNEQILQSRQQEVDALRRQLTNYETQLQEKKRKEAIREQLAIFLNEGDTLRTRCLKETSAPPPQKEADEWATRVNRYLISNADRSYSARFLSSPAPLPISHTGVPKPHDGLWGGITAKMEVLRSFIEELSH